VLLVTGLLASAVVIISALLAWNTRNALLTSAEASGQMVANLLARSAGLANEIPNEVEEMLGAQMVAEARITAHFVDAAEKAGFQPEEINRQLRQLADTTVLDEFWITDEKGHAYLRNIDVDFTFSPSALEQPQAYAFWPLLSGKRRAWGSTQASARWGIEGAAHPGTILITHDTWSLVKDLVDAKETPSFKVKGIAQPIQAYEVLGLSGAPSAKIIRRNADGLRVTIDLGRSDRDEAVRVLKELIGEIDGDARRMG
jgi:hypothetical protein